MISKMALSLKVGMISNVLGGGGEGEGEGEKRKRSSSSSKLEIGSPVIVIKAPQVLKTAASVPCLRPNAGLVNPGDVGRIISRKPKDVWAVRLKIGTYLLDAQYFMPLDLSSTT